MGIQYFNRGGYRLRRHPPLKILVAHPLWHHRRWAKQKNLIFYSLIKGTMDKFNIIPQLFPKKVGIFIPLAVLAWVMTACRVLCSRLIYFWRNTNIYSIFYFSKSTLINTQYGSLWDTLRMMLLTKYLLEWQRIGRISWKFRYWFDLESSREFDIKKMLYLSNAPLNF